MNKTISNVVDLITGQSKYRRSLYIVTQARINGFDAMQERIRNAQVPSEVQVRDTAVITRFIRDVYGEENLEERLKLYNACVEQADEFFCGNADSANNRNKNSADSLIEYVLRQGKDNVVSNLPKQKENYLAIIKHLNSCRNPRGLVRAYAQVQGESSQI